MNTYLQDLAVRLMRVSRASLDIGTAKKLRELSYEVGEKADEPTGGDSSREDNGTSNGDRPH